MDSRLDFGLIRLGSPDRRLHTCTPKSIYQTYAVYAGIPSGCPLTSSIIPGSIAGFAAKPCFEFPTTESPAAREGIEAV